MENSRGSLMFSVVRRMTKDSARLMINIRSSTKVGSGMISRKIIATTRAETALLNSFKTQTSLLLLSFSFRL